MRSRTPAPALEPSSNHLSLILLARCITLAGRSSRVSVSCDATPDGVVSPASMVLEIALRCATRRLSSIWLARIDEGGILRRA